MRVLTWNLYHGRAIPPAGHELLGEFAEALAGWAWDVALLQEVPPWWPAPLATATGSHARSVRTSRNAGLALRRALARRHPDLMKSSGGGANAILVRGLEIAAHRTRRLRWWPERRWVHAVALPGGCWVGNVHAQSHPPARARADTTASAAALRAWAGAAPFVLGGDFNVHAPAVPGLVVHGGHHVDHVMSRGFAAAGPAEVLERGELSDHAPVLVDLREGSPGGRGPEGA